IVRLVRDDFFFASGRRHTSWPRDWSSAVCSSDLPADEDPLVVLDPATSGELADDGFVELAPRGIVDRLEARLREFQLGVLEGARSEERRVGKECSCGGPRPRASDTPEALAYDRLV